jgi:hypothetical protein
MIVEQRRQSSAKGQIAYEGIYAKGLHTEIYALICITDWIREAYMYVNAFKLQTY